MSGRLFATLPLAIAVAVSACGASESGSPSSEGGIVVSATEGTVKGVAYSEARCSKYDYGDSGYEWCRTRVGANSVFFGGDPIESITVTRVPVPGCRPSDYPEVPDNVCAP